MLCPNCGDKMNEIPEADPVLMRCPSCMTTLPKPKAKPKK
jgi:predicted amidophosphoribosyltransferase